MNNLCTEKYNVYFQVAKTNRVPNCHVERLDESENVSNCRDSIGNRKVVVLGEISILNDQK